MRIVLVSVACAAIVGLGCGRGREAGGGLEDPLVCWPNPACRQVYIAAHRGLPSRLPEESLAGVRAALQAGADVVTVEVHQTKDGVPVLLADDRVDRTTDGTGDVWDFTLADLEQLELKGATEDPETQHVPRLSDVLALFPGRRALLQLDTTGADAKQVAELVAATPAAAQVLYSDADPLELEAIHGGVPGAGEIVPDFDDPADLRTLSLRFAPVHAARLARDSSRSFLAAESGARNGGVRLVLYDGAADQLGVAGNPSGWLGLLHAGVDVIVTDDAEALLALARAQGLHE